MNDPELNIDQQRFLLESAREAIRRHLESGKKPRIAVSDGVFKEKRGAFVTLKLDGRLRGCIGYPMPQDSLFETVIDAAVLAATRDTRFPPLTLEELPRTTIEISVLTPPRRIHDVAEIRVGEHGIIVSRGFHRGLLLPQVPLEWGWDRETFLRHACLKAGLDEDAWKAGADIEAFKAQVFSE
jgi:AmmeMemoRadiSam system protein A